MTDWCCLGGGGRLIGIGREGGMHDWREPGSCFVGCLPVWTACLVFVGNLFLFCRFCPCLDCLFWREGTSVLEALSIFGLPVWRESGSVL